jgi:MoaA/NifB/PqqE/SkfB family radical SAM enzyme
MEPSKILKYSPMYYNPGESEVVFLNLNVSDVCNYNCLKCFQGRMRPSLDSLDLEDLIGIIDQAKKELDVKAMYISGRGETFLVGSGSVSEKIQNYKKLIKHANKIGISVCQFTNGYYLNREIVDFLVNQNVSVVVSLDTLDEKKYKQLFCPPEGAFQRVMANIDYARKKFPVDGQTYRLGINMAISRPNFDEVNAVRDFCGEDIIFFSNYPMLRGNFRNNLEKMCLSLKEYEKFKQKVRETSAYQNLAGMCQNQACGFYYNGLTIDVNGNVLLSPYDISTGRLFGNIRDYPNMLEAVKKVRQSIKAFIAKFPDAKSCPLRHLDYGEFPKFVT